MPRSEPSSTKARNVATAATTPNSAGTSRRASTSMETKVSAFAATNVTVDQATPPRSDEPKPSGASGAVMGES
jgi:hypothetical protein